MGYFLRWALVGAPFLLVAGTIEGRVFRGSENAKTDVLRTAAVSDREVVDGAVGSRFSGSPANEPSRFSQTFDFYFNQNDRSLLMGIYHRTRVTFFSSRGKILDMRTYNL